MNRDQIVIGGSAGCLDNLLSIAEALPSDFTGNVFIAVHVGRSRSQLPELLTRSSKLPATHPRDHEAIRPGHIYVAPPDCHMLVEPGLIRLSHGPSEHFTRPAIDPLFRSAAAAYAERVIGVVLSGGGSDGSAGLDTIKRMGGLAVVLDPRDAGMPDMPQAAAEIVHPHYLAPALEIPTLLVRLSREAAPAPRTPVPTEVGEPMPMRERPLALTCPDCGGALRQIEGSAAPQYRCHIGHLYGATELLPAQVAALERALEVAQRVLNERIELSRRMVDDAKANGRRHGTRYWQKLQAETEKQAETIREVLSVRLEEPNAEAAADEIGPPHGSAN
jgi:two-component system, chemotaxis family, protein-glutamate methylesterase/glutaminase